MALRRLGDRREDNLRNPGNALVRPVDKTEEKTDLKDRDRKRFEKTGLILVRYTGRAITIGGSGASATSRRSYATV